MEIHLRRTIEADLETLFAFQTNAKANYMAAFTAENPADKEAYMKKWSKIAASDVFQMHTILKAGEIVGSIVHFEMFEEWNVSYWIGEQYWGQGLGTKALALYLDMINQRPLYGRVAFDNYGSQHVLEKCGFQLIKKEQGFANARQAEIEELVYKLL